MVIRETRHEHYNPQLIESRWCYTCVSTFEEEHTHGAVQSWCDECGDLRDELDETTRRELGLDE